jgi:hypothetical protein
VRSGKCAERKVAEILGGRRVPVSGRQRGDVPDVEHEGLSIEVKSRKVTTKWLEGAMEQAEAAADSPQLPVVVIHEARRPYRESLVIMRLKGFARYLERG